MWSETVTVHPNELPPAPSTTRQHRTAHCIQHLNKCPAPMKSVFGGDVVLAGQRLPHAETKKNRGNWKRGTTGEESSGAFFSSVDHLGAENV